MSQLSIRSQSHNYDVVIETGVRHQLDKWITKPYSSVLIVTDRNVSEHYLQDVVTSMEKVSTVHTALVPSGEASKSMGKYQELLDRCIETSLDRQSLIIALGGGMIGDLAGFVASTYLRGIDFIQMPTTILAHDSSVGGKVAVNHVQGKNLIGSFYSPVQVLYDIETLRTLPETELRSGYGEVMKHAMLSDSAWLEELLGRSITSLEDNQLIGDLEKGIRVKASIVEKDEREQGMRKFLNLGHTLAHAIEAELGYGEITHGEAVSIGLLFALQLSETRVNASGLPIKDYVNWMARNGYPLSSIQSLQPVALLKRMKVDKKTVNQQVHFVLLNEIGKACVVPIQDDVLLTELHRFQTEVVNV
ncbi:3-dehydroquinate synthase [Halobacillus locisalis]|uniref:3-dehydroquinate synthase n=1 Tax=Halobacillus locisalis TaxID=220753 RepID=A0A838CPU2_9BACI|nr:3-dehydroquinate synthase [Halobacillus locisalis]MBA2173878.1 3-dehydroquinate synthase [Halobacillus locisalis]